MIGLIGAKTHFSVGESILPPEYIVEEAARQGYEYVAIADVNSINAMIPIFTKAKELGVGPIIGVTFNVVDSLTWRKPKKDEKKTQNRFFMPTLYVQNEDGLRDVMALLTKANDDDHFYNTPQIHLDELLETFERGNVVMTSGTLHSVFAHKDSAQILARIAACCSASKFVYELVPYKTAYFEELNRRVLSQWGRWTRPVVFSQPALHKPDERSIRDTIDCVMGNKLKSTPWSNQLPTDYCIMSASEVEAALTGQFELPEFESIKKAAWLSTENFASMFAFEWKKMDVTLPKLYSDPFARLKELCIEGFKKRVMQETLGYRPERSAMPAYRERLEYELGVLRDMKFEDYFLLVHHIVSWCKTSGIEVGPGRGSVGGSLVAYLIGITDVDPIRFGLFFERFINPDRLDLPDIDLDFMSSRRHEVIQQLILQFGEDRVAGISNYSMLGPASALRSVAKAHGLDVSEYECSKYIPKTHGVSSRLEDAVAEVPELEAFALKHKWVWQEATLAQDAFRSYSQHAAGVIVAGEPVSNRAVIETRTEAKVVNWDKRNVEDFGFVKLDILGLTTLDVLSRAKTYVQGRTGKKLDLTKIPLDDPKVLNAFRQGKTVGVFQFESGGMRTLLKSLGEVDPLSFEDITAATALFRPGPMESGLMTRFIQIKQGNDEVAYLHENMREALKETYGVIVYQEQVMQLARDLAGFSMAESDHLRKAMGKKDPAKMAELRDQWTSGCISHSDLDKDVAERLFDQIEMFAGYAFNKSHSVEYSVISYWAMFLKVYYPAEFYASVMTVLQDKKIAMDCVSAGIRILPPDINHSSDRFEIVETTSGTVLYTPFQLIKGLSEKASQAILEAKEKIGRPFASKDEFIKTVSRRVVNIRVQDRLDKIGAFAEIEPGQIPATHHDRLKDQKEFLPDTTVSSVKADRKIDANSVAMAGLSKMVDDCAKCGKCTLAGAPHPVPRLGKSAKVMIVMDCPNWSEREAMKMGEGDASKPLRDALKSAGMSMKDVYVTALIKAPKPSGAKIENEMINGCGEYLKQEIELLKPPVIVTMGGAASRFLLPELKGGWEEVLGQEQYDSKRDTTIIVGMNPMQVFFDSRKQKQLNEVFAKVVDLIT